MSAYQVDRDVIDLITSAAITTEFGRDRHAGHVSIYWRGWRDSYTPAIRATIELRDDAAQVYLLRVPCTHEGAAIIGAELVAANCASVAARYPDDTRADAIGGMIGYLPSDYVYRSVRRSRFSDYGHVFGSLACYAYQSCETGRQTVADEIIRTIREHVAMRVFDETDGGRPTWAWSRDYVTERERELRATIGAAS